MLEQGEQRGRQVEDAIPGNGHQPAHHPFDILPGHVFDAALADCRAEMPVRLSSVIAGRAFRQSLGGDAGWRVLAEEPIQSVVHGRRFACFLPAGQWIALAGADAGGLGAGALTRLAQRDLAYPCQDGPPLPFVYPVVENAGFRACRRDADS